MVSAEERKGLQFIIQAVRNLRKKHVFNTIILGDINIPDILNDDLFICKGLLPHKDAINILSEADCVIIPSLNEVCSYAGIEALSFGLPVITTNGYGLYEMFDGVAKMVDAEFSTCKWEQYETFMEEVFTDEKLRREMAEKSRERFQYYQLNTMVQKTHEVYRKYANG
jgi:glycosyltransferase involved in cell wall biosynthesis